mmetsp:Transcript_89480/g.227596  ORF Transcript_89480/g.227596 Transcript_89480/m.227596 type:complete len:315 (-) Transcript_89480:210-1154(-)
MAVHAPTFSSPLPPPNHNVAGAAKRREDPVRSHADDGRHLAPVARGEGAARSEVGDVISSDVAELLSAQQHVLVRVRVPHHGDGRVRGVLAHGAVAELLLARGAEHLHDAVAEGDEHAALVWKHRHDRRGGVDLAHGLQGLEAEDANALLRSNPQTVRKLQMQRIDGPQRDGQRRHAVEGPSGIVVPPSSHRAVQGAREEHALVDEQGHDGRGMPSQRELSKGLLPKTSDLSVLQAAKEELGSCVPHQGSHGGGEVHLVVLPQSQSAAKLLIAAPEQQSVVGTARADTVAHDDRGPDALFVADVLGHGPDLQQL